MKGIKNLHNLPKRKVTVEDILYRADIDGVLSDINKDKEEIEEILVIAVTRDNKIMWRYSDLTMSRLIYLMEKVKLCLLSEE